MKNIIYMRVQSGKKTYCAAFCASPVAILAGSGYNASCNGLQWLETAAHSNKERQDEIVFEISLLRKQFSPAC